MIPRETLAIAALALAPSACAVSTDSPRAQRSAIVYGVDDRRDYFELDGAEAQQLVAESMLALMPRAMIEPGGSSDLTVAAPNLSDVEDLCDGERFADQPAAAFCSGVLLDWDLVLTASHCAHAVRMGDFVAVAGYYYAAPHVLSTSPADVLEVDDIVAEEHDKDGDVPRLDFAWLRLHRPAALPRMPAAFTRRLADPDEAISAVSTTAGVPMKLDAGGHIVDPRAASADYFVADTDTAHGSSGGAAFNRQLAVMGILARGGDDFVEDTGSNCRRTRQESRRSQAVEQFTYVDRALSSLCAVEPRRAICHDECGQTCRAALRAADLGSIGPAGCALRSGACRAGWPFPVIALVSWRMRRKRLTRRRVLNINLHRKRASQRPCACGRDDSTSGRSSDAWIGGPPCLL